MVILHIVNKMIDRARSALMRQAALNKMFNTEALLALFLMKIRAATLIIKFIFTLFLTKFLSLEVVGFYGLVTEIGRASCRERV